MRGIVIAAGLMVAATGAVAQGTSTASDHYLRCAAVSFVLSKEHPVQDERERYGREFDLHRKWGSWFYPDDYPRFKTESLKALQAIQSELKSKQLGGKAFVSEAQACTALQIRTSASFVQCIGKGKPDDQKRYACAREAVGL